MKTLVCTRPGELNYEEAEKPLVQAGQALLRVRRVGICGTDLHAYEGTQPFFDYPRILGHELAVEFVEANGATGFVPGEKLTFIPYFNCGHCIACRNGQPNCCVNMQVFGVHIHGGFCEYITVPITALVKGQGLGFDELSLVEPLAIGAHGVRRAGVRPGEFVLVVGAGPIGLGTAEMARIAGAEVIVMDINEQRLDFCRNHLGLRHVVNPVRGSAVEELSRITSGDMPTVVIDATGSLRAINEAFAYLAHGGRYVLVGLQKGEISFNHPQFHKREATLMSSRNALRADFEWVIESLKAGKVKPTDYITHRVGFDEVKDHFASWLDPRSGVIKATVELT